MISDADFTAAWGRYRSGRDVARALGMAPSVAFRRSRKLGLPPKRNKGRPPNVDLPKRAQAMRQRGMSYRQIAAALGTCASNVWRHIRAVEAQP